jgi:hypothetical protein
MVVRSADLGIFGILGGYLWNCGGYLMTRPITDRAGIEIEIEIEIECRARER